MTIRLVAALAFTGFCTGTALSAQTRFHRYRAEPIQLGSLFGGFTGNGSINDAGDVADGALLFRPGSPRVDIATAVGLATVVAREITNSGFIYGTHRTTITGGSRSDVFRWNPNTGILESFIEPSTNNIFGNVCAGEDGSFAIGGSGGQLYVRSAVGAWTIRPRPGIVAGFPSLQAIPQCAVTTSGQFLCRGSAGGTTYPPALVSATATTYLPPLPTGMTDPFAIDCNSSGAVLVTAGGGAEWLYDNGTWQALPASFEGLAVLWLSVDEEGRLYGRQSASGPGVRQVVVMIGSEIVSMTALIDDPDLETMDAGVVLVSDRGTMLTSSQVLVAGVPTPVVLLPGAPCLTLEVGPGSSALVQPEVATGALMSMTIRGGQSGELCAIFLADSQGGVIAPPVFLGILDQGGTATFTAFIPTSFANTALRFKAAALDSQFGIMDAPTRTVRFL